MKMFSRINVDRWRYFVILLFTLPFGFGQKPKLQTMIKWSQIEFDFANAKEKQHAIETGEYIPGNILPLDVDVYVTRKDSKYFVTTPKFQKGVPASLGIVTKKKFNGNPLVKPYPSWDWHKNSSECQKNRIVSVIRVMIDECHRLWVLDNGVIEGKLTCPPQVLAFDLRKNNLSHRFKIPSSLIAANSLLVNPAVDVRDVHEKCRDTFIYIADSRNSSIIVYDVRNNKAWKVRHESMAADPDYVTFNILGDSFKLSDGVVGMSLSPFKAGEDRKLFYHAMSSDTENWMYTSVLRNRKKFHNHPEASSDMVHTYEGRRNTQSGPEAMTSDGIMFFGLMSNVTLNCWNTSSEYGLENIATVADDQDTLQFISGLKVKKNAQGREEIIAFSTRHQKSITGTISNSEINFRIMKGEVKDLLSGIKLL